MLDRIAWLLLALLHLPPALALLRPAMIGSLYGVARDTPAFPLLQHRAALFAGVLLVCLWAVAAPGVRRLATLVCAISMLTFPLLYWLAGAPPTLGRVATADLLFLPVLAFASWRAFRA